VSYLQATFKSKLLTYSLLRLNQPPLLSP